MADRPKYHVRLVDQATVVARGERLQIWFLRQNDAWVHAKDHPAAVVEVADSRRADAGCPPGTVWHRQLELVVPSGTVLRCVISTPLDEHLDPMAYLTAGKMGSRRKVTETHHRVVGNYRLERERSSSPRRRASSRRV